jgi:hypothetical protein
MVNICEQHGVYTGAECGYCIEDDRRWEEYRYHATAECGDEECAAQLARLPEGTKRKEEMA